MHLAPVFADDAFLYAVLDSYEWKEVDIDAGGDADELAILGRFVSCVSSIARVWRLPGNHKKIWNEAARQFDEEIGCVVGKKRPGRVVRTRWGSIASIIAVILRVMQWSPSIYSALFPIVLARPKGKAKAKGPKIKKNRIDDSAEAHRREIAGIKNRATSSLLSKAFNVSIRVADISLGPLTRFQFWVQKKTGEWNTKCAAAKEENGVGCVCFAPIVLSMLVSDKCLKVRG